MKLCYSKSKLPSRNKVIGSKRVQSRVRRSKRSRSRVRRSKRSLSRVRRSKRSRNNFRKNAKSRLRSTKRSRNKRSRHKVRKTCSHSRKIRASKSIKSSKSICKNQSLRSVVDKKIENYNNKNNINTMEVMYDSNFELSHDSTNIGLMFIKHRNTITRNGHPKELLISGLQKYIRRNEFNKAIYCLVELDDFRILREPAIMREYLERYPDREAKATLSLVKALQTNVSNRLRVISVEDVGIAQPGVCKIVDDLLTRWEDSDRLDVNLLIEIVRILCSSRKLRFISDLKSVYNLIPYYGDNDMENDRIARFTRILRDYYDIGQPSGDENMHNDDLSVFYWISENMKDVTFKHKIWDIIRDRCDQSYKSEIDTLRKWFKKGQPAKETPIYFYHAVILSISSDILKNIKPINLVTILYPPNTNRLYRLKHIDNYCNDKHVIGSGETSVTRFAVEGALCINEATEILNKNFRELYIHLKMAIDEKKDLDEERLISLYPRILEDEEVLAVEIPSFRPAEVPVSDLESYYKFIVRAQPNTSATKADAYFADDPLTREFLFVKGPLKSVDDAENSIAMNEWKKENGLPYMKSLRIRMLKPDRWPEGVGLGLRNSLDRNKEAPFLISESTIDRAKIVENIVTYGEYKVLKKDKTVPKKWPLDLELVNWFNIPSHLDITKLTNVEFSDYVLNLLARWIFGISDLADRNFLRKNGHIHSIDEEYRDKTVNFWNELKKNKCATIVEWLNNNYESVILPRVSKWVVPKEYVDKLTKLLNIDYVKSLFEKE